MLSREIVNFVFPRISMFPETKSRETLRFEGKQNSLFPEGAYIKLSALLYSDETNINIEQHSYNNICIS